jgi:hypothetical protein
MFKINQIASLTFFYLIFCSCNGQLNTSDVCKKKFKEARDLVYSNPNAIHQSALDSAMNLANECMQCDSIKKAVVDFKITLLVSMKKFNEGISFIDSLSDSDFSFGYQKKMMSKSLKALTYDSKSDTANRNLVYTEMANDLEQYIKSHELSDKEFKDIYTYLYIVKGNFLGANQINKEVESLEKKYPDKITFFEFLKK